MSAGRATERALRHVRDAARIFHERGGRTLAGAVSFYALLSSVPILVLVLEGAGALTSTERARDGLATAISVWVGAEGTRTLLELLDRARESGDGAGWLGALMLAYGATRLFSHLRRAMHVLWGVAERRHDRLGLRLLAQLHKRLLGVALVIVMAALVVALVALKAVASAFAQRTGVSVPWSLLHGLSAFASSLVLFACIFQLLPEGGPAPRVRLWGAGLTAVLFAAGALAVGEYVGHKMVRSVWGAASSLVMLLLWVAYSAQVFLYGVALTAALGAAREEPKA